MDLCGGNFLFGFPRRCHCGRFGSYLLFSARWRGRGSRGDRGGGVSVLIENSRRGGGGFSQKEGRGWPGGREGVCGELGGGGAKYFIRRRNSHQDAIMDPSLVAQCSATPATVAATPPCSATLLQTQISVRHLPAQGGRCDTKIFRGCSATLVLHLQNAIKSRKSAATRVARHV